MKLFAPLILPVFALVFLALPLLLNAGDGTVPELPAGAPVRSGGESLMAEVLYPLFDKTQDAVAKAHLCTPIDLMTGKSIDEILLHYKGLASFLTDNVSSPDNGENLGDGSSGYGFINQTLNPEKDLPQLLTLLPKACHAYEESKGKMSWENWRSQFNNDAHLAFLGMLLQQGWVKGTFNEGQIGHKRAPVSIYNVINASDRAVKDSKYRVQGDLYDNGVFVENAFGLDLKQPVGDTSFGSQNYGRAYKTVAGLNMGLALWEAGYSRNDGILASQKATLFYEASDLLYDHLGKEGKCGVAKCKDAPNPALTPSYNEFQQNVLKKLDTNPSLKKQLFGKLAGVEGLASLIPDAALPVDLRDPKKGELVLAALLLNSYTQDPQGFEKTFGDDFTQNKQDLLQLFAAGKRDIDSITAGATFVYDQLANDPQPNPKWEGALGGMQKLSNICELPGQALNSIEAAVSGAKSKALGAADWLTHQVGIVECLNGGFKK